MSISTEIERLKKAKKDLFAAITAKGGILNEAQKLDEYSDAVDMISLSVEGSGKYRVRFFDYDGTILKTVYTDGGAVTAPNVPEHDRLLFQEWNNDFDDITSDLDVGAIYTTKSGKCEFDVWVTKAMGEYPASNPRGDKVVCFNPYLVSGTLTIDWGDGIVETLTTVGGANLTHTYPAYGRYTIIVGVSEGGAWKPAAPLFSNGGLTGTGAEDYSVVAIRLTGFNTAITAAYSFGLMMFCKTATISTGVTWTGDIYLFQGCKSLKHLTIPRGLTNTRYALCNYCWSLRSLILPQGLQTIERSMVNECFALTDIVIPQTVSKIWFWGLQGSGIRKYETPPLVTTHEDVFGGCRWLTEFVIGENVTIVNASFLDMDTLHTVKSRAILPPQLGARPSTAKAMLKEIIVPAGCAEAYKSATNWSTFADIIKEEEI